MRHPPRLPPGPVEHDHARAATEVPRSCTHPRGVALGTVFAQWELMAQTFPQPRSLAPTLPDLGLAPSHPGLDLRAYGASDIGRTRRRNEDQFVVATLTGTLWV